MSYDVSLYVASGEHATAEVRGWNCTSNVAPMWRHAGCDLADFDGKTATQLADALAPAVADMKARPRVYEAMNPENGWGDYAGCLAFLEDLLRHCRAHNYATVRVHR